MTLLNGELIDWFLTILVGKPTIEFQTKDLIVVEGEKMHLPIPFKAVPSPRITWHKDGKEMKADERLSLRSDYISCHLEIPSCLHADAGQYKVTLENSLGAISGTINVKVIGMIMHSYISTTLHDILHTFFIMHHIYNIYFITRTSWAMQGNCC